MRRGEVCGIGKRGGGGDELLWKRFYRSSK